MGCSQIKDDGGREEDEQGGYFFCGVEEGMRVGREGLVYRSDFFRSRERE